MKKRNRWSQGIDTWTVRRKDITGMYLGERKDGRTRGLPRAPLSFLRLPLATTSKRLLRRLRKNPKQSRDEAVDSCFASIVACQCVATNREALLKITRSPWHLQQGAQMCYRAFNLFTFFRADLIQSEASWQLSSTFDWLMSAWKNVN